LQELFYERPYMVLPPLLEWVRVSTAFTEYRHSTYVDNDDILQAGDEFWRKLLSLHNSFEV